MIDKDLIFKDQINPVPVSKIVSGKVTVTVHEKIGGGLFIWIENDSTERREILYGNLSEFTHSSEKKYST